MPTQAEIDFFTQNGTLTPHHIIGGAEGNPNQAPFPGLKRIDDNNVGIFMRMKKEGTLVEVQLA